MLITTKVKTIPFLNKYTQLSLYFSIVKSTKTCYNVLEERYFIQSQIPTACGLLVFFYVQLRLTSRLTVIHYRCDQAICRCNGLLLLPESQCKIRKDRSYNAPFLTDDFSLKSDSSLLYQKTNLNSRP